MNDQEKNKINVIKPNPGGGGKVFVVGLLLFLAVVGVAVGAFLLYQRRTVTPVPGRAATTTQIQDNLDGPNLNTTVWRSIADFAGTNVTFGSGNMNVFIDDATTTGGVEQVNQITGDFSAEVSVVAVNNGNATLVFDTGSTKVEVARSESGIISKNGNTTNPIGLTNTAFPTELKIVRVGDTIQTFYNNGDGYLLAGSYSGATVADGRLGLVVSKGNTTNAPANAQFDTFRAEVNVSGAPTPVPGTAPACQLAFAVLDLAVPPGATVTPTPTPVPGATVTPTPTPVPGATVTPTPVPGASPTPTPVPGATVTPTPVTGTPNACNGTCGSNDNCQSGMFCFNGYCRNPNCAEETDCACESGSVAPTPVTTLEKSGASDGLWLTLVVGVVMVIAGSVMLLAL